MSIQEDAVAGFLPRRDLKRGRLLQTKLTRSAETPRQDKAMSGTESSARSARTRRFYRSARLRPDIVLAIGRAPSGPDEKWQSIKYRDVSVKHATTSPSHRDRSRQVAVLRALQDPPLPNRSSVAKDLSAQTNLTRSFGSPSKLPSVQLVRISFVQSLRDTPRLA
jgi:hypothetical protein